MMTSGGIDMTTYVLVHGAWGGAHGFRHVRKATGKFVNERTKRRPMIVPVVLEA